MKIKRKTIRALIFWGSLFAIVGVITLVWYLYYVTSLFTITTYLIKGVTEEQSTRLLAVLPSRMQGMRYIVIPNNKIFTYHEDEIRRSIQEEVTDVRQVSVRSSGLRTLTIEVQHRIPLFRVADGKVIDENGFLFVIDDKKSQGLPFLDIASSTKGTQEDDSLIFSFLEYKELPLSSSFLHTLQTFSSKVSDILFPVTRVQVTSSGDVYFFAESGNTSVIVKEGMNEKITWSTLVSAIDTEPLKSKLLKDKENLEYLDVRYGNKVFYRFSDMEFQNNGTSDILNHHATTTQTASTTN